MNRWLLVAAPILALWLAFAVVAYPLGLMKVHFLGR